MASTEIEVIDPAATVENLTKIKSGRALSRRNFMAAAGVTGAAAGAALMTSRSSGPRTVAAAGPTQSDVLNFALNLEFLEATFYSYICTGADLPISLTVGSGAITGNPSKLTFTGTNAAQITDLFNELYYDELSHVKDLVSVIGGAAVARPAINLAAYAAITANNAIGIARLFEDVGVTAYAGAAPLLTGTNLTYASQILGVEAMHAGAIRLTAIQNPGIAPYYPANGGVTPTAGAASSSITFTGTATAGSPTLTNVYYLVAVPAAPFSLVGQIITGPGISGSGTKITAVAPTSSAAPVNTAITGTTTAGSPIITAVSSFTNLAVGNIITGTGVPAGATITILNAAASTLTISASVTGTAGTVTTKVALTVGTGTITLSSNASASVTSMTYNIGSTDSQDVAPYDPGVAATSAAGPNSSGGFFSTSSSVAGTATNLTPAGLAFARTTSQVLAILYGAVGVDAVTAINKGGFFPLGVNGVINTV